MENKSLLRSEGLVKVYKKRTVVNNVSISVQQGEVVGLLGPNGAGKTTTFYMIVGMIKPLAGKVFLDNNEITHEPMYKRAKKGIGYLPQEASIFRRLTVEDNIMAILQMLDLPDKERKERQEKLLEELGIVKVRKTMGYQLSGGERRRTEIARALATEPKFILLDEPFAGVDPIAVEDIMNIVANLKNKNIGILITDHNVHETLSIVDRAYILINGQIFLEGTANLLAQDNDVRKMYLGEKFRLDRYSED
jgi:lipopolysaccharide export system ATP-binding protein